MQKRLMAVKTMKCAMRLAKQHKVDEINIINNEHQGFSQVKFVTYPRMDVANSCNQEFTILVIKKKNIKILNHYLQASRIAGFEYAYSFVTLFTNLFEDISVRKNEEVQGVFNLEIKTNNNVLFNLLQEILETFTDFSKSQISLIQIDANMEGDLFERLKSNTIVIDETAFISEEQFEVLSIEFGILAVRAMSIKQCNKNLILIKHKMYSHFNKQNEKNKKSIEDLQSSMKSTLKEIINSFNKRLIDAIEEDWFDEL